MSTREYYDEDNEKYYRNHRITRTFSSNHDDVNLSPSEIVKGYDVNRTNNPITENKISHKKTVSSNRKMYDFSEVADYNGSFFQGTWNENRGMISNYTPFITGYSYIYWTKLPSFLADIKIEEFSNISGTTQTIDALTAFKWMTIKNFKSFDGLNDIELVSEDYNGAYGSSSIGIPSNINKGNNEFTIKHYELSGSPIRRLYELWVNGIIDTDTGISNYAGLPNSAGNSYQFLTQNHTGELMYIVTDPSGGAMRNSIEFVGYYTNVYPTKIPLSHLNYASGEHNIAEIDIPFKGVFHQNLEDDYLYSEATKLLPFLQQFRNSDQFVPTTSYNTDTSDYNYNEWTTAI